MTDATLLRQMPVLETQTTNKRDSRRWSLTSLIPNSMIRSARLTETSPLTSSQLVSETPQSRRSAIEVASAPPDRAAAKPQRRDARRFSWVPSSFASSSNLRRLSLGLTSASSHTQSTSEAATLVEARLGLVKRVSDMPSLRLTLAASTHRDGFYRTSEPLTGSVSLPRFDKQGREVKSVKVELYGTMTIHMLYAVPAGPLSAHTKAVPREWRTNFHHQMEQLLAPSDVSATQQHIELPLRFVLPARTDNVISRLDQPLPPSLRLGSAPPAQDGAFSIATETEMPSAEIKYEIFVHVKREGASHKFKGLVPAKRENLASTVLVRPHATRPTVPVREIGLLPLPVESESSALARQRRRNSSMVSPSTPPVSRRSEDAVGDSRRSSTSSELSGGRMSFAMQRESGLSLMETSRGLQGWTAHRITSQLNGRSNVEVEISWPAQTALPLGAWVPFSLKTLLPSEVTLAGSTASAIRLTLLRSVRSVSPAGSLSIEQDRCVPLDVRLDDLSASPPGDEYGCTSIIMGKMRVHEGVDASGQAPIPSFSFKRLRVEYRLVLAVSLRKSASPCTSVSSPIGHTSAMAYSVTLEAPLQVVCDAEILASLAERRERRMSNRLVRNAVDAALARLEGRQQSTSATERTAVPILAESSTRVARGRTSMGAAAIPATLPRPATPPSAILGPASSPSARALRSSSPEVSSGVNGTSSSPPRSFSDRVPVTYPTDIAPSSPQRSPQRSPRSSGSPTRSGSLRSKVSPVAVKPTLAIVPPSPTVLASTNTQSSPASMLDHPLPSRQNSSLTLRAASTTPGTSANAQRTSRVLAPTAYDLALRARMSTGSLLSDCSASTMPSSPGLPPSYLCSVQPR